MGDDDVAETTAIPVAGPLADLSGSVVAGRYHLTAVLGQGAMANVYRARDGRLDREVAVKLFHAGQGPVVRTRFGAEAQALARLSHPGLVGIYDAGVAGDRPYLVMQLVDGESLRDRLFGGPLDPDDVALLGARLATALAHVHGNGVVHRDIKPSNIVLDGNGSPHLADFGIALLLDSVRMTGSGEIMGTAAYLSPEQILGVNVGAAADVYSLGLVLLECITGQLEYPGVTKVESALARLHRSPRIPSGVPAVLAELLAAMTAREPAARPSAGDCAAWFWAIREHSGMSSRGARLAAVEWLSAKGRQFGTSRLREPAFSGWRKYTVAGSGIAMAILASTWLFTSLLPRVMPPLPMVGGTEASPSTAPGLAGPNIDLHALPQAMHMAAAVDTPARAATSAVGATTTASPLGTSSTQLAITSTLFDGTPTSSAPPDFVLQESRQEPSADAGPNSPPPTTTPPTSTTETGVSAGPNSPPETTPPGTPTTTPDQTTQGGNDQGRHEQGAGRHQDGQGQNQNQQ